MRLHYGAIPENADFNPQAEGWRKIPFDPDPILLQVIALPVALFLLAIWGVLFFLTLPLNISLQQIFASRVFLFGWLFIILILMPVHELLHAVVHPHWGTSSRTIIGLWLSKVVLYAHYEGEMYRNRFLLVFIAPYLILGLLPLGLLFLPGAALWTPDLIILLGMISLTGSLLACGDIVGVVLLFQIPSGATVRNKGLNTYWKPAVP
jgi:hypothetical protein